MKKEYLNPEMEVMHLQMTGHLLENSMKVSSDKKPNSDALSPDYYDEEDEEEEDW